MSKHKAITFGSPAKFSDPIYDLIRSGARQSIQSAIGVGDCPRTGKLPIPGVTAPASCPYYPFFPDFPAWIQWRTGYPEAYSLPVRRGVFD